MCENPDSKTLLRRLEEKVLMQYQMGEGRLELDDKYAYFKGKAVPIELWRAQAFSIRLPADLYLEVAALSLNATGRYVVQHGNQEYLVEVNGLVSSKYGLHREVKSVAPYNAEQ